MAKCCVVFPQSPFEDLTAFRVRHALLLVSILTSNAPGQWGWSPHSRFPCSSSAHNRLRRCTQGWANPWADSCEGWIRCYRKLSRGNHPGIWLCVHILMLVLCLDKKIRVFLLNGLVWGWEWGGVLGWYGFWLILTGWIVGFFPLYFASIVPICMYRVVIGCE